MKFRRKRRSHARKSSPQRRTVKRRGRHVPGHMVRRANPTMPVLFANPFSTHRKRRATRARVSNPTRLEGLRRRASRVRRHAVVHYKRARRAVTRQRQLAGGGNYTIAAVLRTGVVGMLGIVTARIFGNLYTRYVSEHVRDATDPKSWRNWLDELLRLVAMEAGVLILERVAKKANLGKPMDRLAFAVAGTAEVGRQAIGLGVKHFSPTTDRSRYGLDGYRRGGLGELAPAGWVTSDGRVFEVGSNGEAYQLEGVVPREALQGLMQRARFPVAA